MSKRKDNARAIRRALYHSGKDFSPLRLALWRDLIKLDTPKKRKTDRNTGELFAPKPMELFPK